MNIEERVCALAGANSNARISEIGMDSLDFLQLLVDLENEFKINLTAADGISCETVGDLVDLVSAKSPC